MRRIADATIFRAARRILNTHGERAIPVCEERARQVLRRGDGSGFCLWFRIRAEVETLQMRYPSAGTILH